MEKENKAKKREDPSFLFKVCVYNVCMKVKSKQKMKLLAERESEQNSEKSESKKKEKLYST